MMIELVFWLVIGFVTGWLFINTIVEQRTIKALKKKIDDLEVSRTRDLQWHATTRDALKVELSIRPPAVDKWVLGIAGIAEVFKVPPEKATRILEMGVNFPAPFAYVDHIRIYDHDAVLTWYEEEYPRYKHLVR